MGQNFSKCVGEIFDAACFIGGTIVGGLVGGPGGAVIGGCLGKGLSNLRKSPEERTYEVTFSNNPVDNAKKEFSNSVYNALDKAINGNKPYESYDKIRERVGREEFLNESYKYSKQYETEQRLEENFREKSDWISRLKLEKDKKDFLR